MSITISIAEGQLIVKDYPSLKVLHTGPIERFSIVDGTTVISIRDDWADRVIVGPAPFGSFVDGTGANLGSHGLTVLLLGLGLVPVAPRSVIRRWWPNTGTTIGTNNLSRTSVGTTSTQAPAATNILTATHRWRVVSAATAGAAADDRGTVALVNRSSTQSGFKLSVKVSMQAVPAGARAFFGLSSSVAAFSVTQDPYALTNIVGIGFTQGVDTNWQLISNDGTGTAAKQDLGATYPVSSLALLVLLEIEAAAGGSDVTVHVQNLSPTASVKSSFVLSDAAVIPAAATFLAPRLYANNGATAAAVGFECGGLILETLA